VQETFSPNLERRRNRTRRFLGLFFHVLGGPHDSGRFLGELIKS
jgi:hypothetical protein